MEIEQQHDVRPRDVTISVGHLWEIFLVVTHCTISDHLWVTFLVGVFTAPFQITLRFISSNNYRQQQLFTKLT